jgi:hypothetical protein
MTHTTSAAKEQSAMCGKAAHFQQGQKDCHPLTCQPQPVKRTCEDTANNEIKNYESIL